MAMGPYLSLRNVLETMLELSLGQLLGFLRAHSEEGNFSYLRVICMIKWQKVVLASKQSNYLYMAQTLCAEILSTLILSEIKCYLIA